MAILKDFPYNSALFGFNITTPQIRQEQDDHPKIGGNQKLMSLYIYIYILMLLCVYGYCLYAQNFVLVF